MISHLTCAQLIAAQYAGDKSQFDVFKNPQSNDWSVLAWAAKKVEGVWIICFEGSHDPPDWAQDFRFLPIDRGGITFHRGFYYNMPETWDTIKKACPGPKIFAGHSLGAARADVCTWMALQDGEKALAYVRWGEPAPAYGPAFGNALEGIPGASYRNVKPSPRHANEVDLVTEVPPAIFDARHPQPFCDVYAQPDVEADKWGLLSWHHFGLYLGATPETVIVST